LFTLATLKELQLAALKVLPFVTLCSVRVSALLIVLSYSLCEIIEKWANCTILKEDRFCARLAGASVSKGSTLLGVSTATLFKVMSAYTNQGKTTSAKR
jgi:hypothetical protein